MISTGKVLVCILGPTAIGKTALSIAIAKHFATEIISADSRQFYKEMAIGTAVPSKEEFAQVPHHFIQHRSIHDHYTVGNFERAVLNTLKQLFKDNNIVVMVGGSGLYIDAVTKGLDPFPQVDPKIRTQLNQTRAKEGMKVLQEELKQVDPDYFEKVDLANPHRVIRALGVCRASGKPYSSFLGQKKDQRPFKILTIGLIAERPEIYKRINSRVDHMMEQGLLEEARSLVPFKELNALQTVGYKELFNHLEGKWDLEFAVAEIKKNTRRFAKRQLTWFKKDPAVIWMDFEAGEEKVIETIKKQLKTESYG